MTDWVHHPDCNVWVGRQQCESPDLTRECTCGDDVPQIDQARKTEAETLRKWWALGEKDEA